MEVSFDERRLRNRVPDEEPFVFSHFLTFPYLI